MLRKNLPISIHQTLGQPLEVNWEQAYRDEYHCMSCGSAKLRYRYAKNPACKLLLECTTCRKMTALTCEIPGSRRQVPMISEHRTLKGKLKVDWEKDYKQKFNCPHCDIGHLTKIYSARMSRCKLILICDSCNKHTNLTNSVPRYIYGYKPDICCPNLLCNQIGPDGQKGWIYQRSSEKYLCRCHFCDFEFSSISRVVKSSSRVAKSSSKVVKSSCSCQLVDNPRCYKNDISRRFDYEEDVWDLRHFFDKPKSRYLRFRELKPFWYRQEAKRYLYYLIKARIYSSTSQIHHFSKVLRQLGEIVSEWNLKSSDDFSRQLVLVFIDSCRDLSPKTLYLKLGLLKHFFEYLRLDADQLVKRRDFPKLSQDAPDWLDEVTRRKIKQHLHKIPPPIARQYLVHEYTAARPYDICQLPFECLVEDNGKWYIQFFQFKVKRLHRIPATRTIRSIIEHQQKWIRQKLGEKYPYLFCHFQSIYRASYPRFANIEPLPEPPKVSTNSNSMVQIIRCLIEQEKICDVNGKAPHFTGKIIRASRLQEIRVKYGMEAAQIYADHKSSTTTFKYYAPPTQEEISIVDLPFQELLLNSNNKFLPWQSHPESLLKNPKTHELDIEITPRLVVYGYCALDPKTPCPYNLYPKCYGCNSFRPSTDKITLYERQYSGEIQRMEEAQTIGSELAFEEAKNTVEAMDQWLPQLREVANG